MLRSLHSRCRRSRSVSILPQKSVVHSKSSHAGPGCVGYSTMNSVVLREPGPISNMVVGESPIPEPGPGEVRVKVSACSVCYRDVLDRQGAFPFIKKGIIMGHEAAGVVDKIGPGVERLEEGQRVVTLHWGSCGKCPSCLVGSTTTCDDRMAAFTGITANGGYAQYMTMRASGVVAAPKELTAVEAATVMCTYGTFWHAAISRGRLRNRESIVITGATGGVGSAAVQMALAMGCRTVAVTSNESKVDYLKSLGVKEIIVAPDGKFSRDPILKGGVHMAFEGVGAPTFDSSLRSLKPGGRLILIGNVTAAEVKLKLGIPILQELDIIGCDSCTADELTQVFGFMLKTGIRPNIHKVLKLHEVHEAHELLEKRAVSGRIVLQIGREW